MSLTIIEVSKRLTDDGNYHAQLKDHPEIWSCGKSELEAIGSLIIIHQEELSIKIDYLGENCR